MPGICKGKQAPSTGETRITSVLRKAAPQVFSMRLFVYVQDAHTLLSLYVQTHGQLLASHVLHAWNDEKINCIASGRMGGYPPVQAEPMDASRKECYV